MCRANISETMLSPELACRVMCHLKDPGCMKNRWRRNTFKRWMNALSTLEMVQGSHVLVAFVREFISTLPVDEAQAGRMIREFGRMWVAVKNDDWDEMSTHAWIYYGFDRYTPHDRKPNESTVMPKTKAKRKRLKFAGKMASLHMARHIIESGKYSCLGALAYTISGMCKPMHVDHTTSATLHAGRIAELCDYLLSLPIEETSGTNHLIILENSLLETSDPVMIEFTFRLAMKWAKEAPASYDRMFTSNTFWGLLYQSSIPMKLDLRKYATEEEAMEYAFYHLLPEMYDNDCPPCMDFSWMSHPVEWGVWQLKQGADLEEMIPHFASFLSTLHDRNHTWLKSDPFTLANKTALGQLMDSRYFGKIIEGAIGTGKIHAGWRTLLDFENQARVRIYGLHSVVVSNLLLS